MPPDGARFDENLSRTARSPKGVLVSLPKPITTTPEGLTTAVVHDRRRVHDCCRFASLPPFGKGDFQRIGRVSGRIARQSQTSW
jgi:hypothetical protein